MATIRRIGSTLRLHLALLRHPRRCNRISPPCASSRHPYPVRTAVSQCLRRGKPPSRRPVPPGPRANRPATSPARARRRRAASSFPTGRAPLLLLPGGESPSRASGPARCLPLAAAPPEASRVPRRAWSSAKSRRSGCRNCATQLEPARWPRPPVSALGSPTPFLFRIATSRPLANTAPSSQNLVTPRSPLLHRRYHMYHWIPALRQNPVLRLSSHASSPPLQEDGETALLCLSQTLLQYGLRIPRRIGK